MNTIPADFIVAVTPGVLSAGGASINLNGMVVTDSDRVPLGAVASFPSGASVTGYFGGGSREDQIANGGSGLGSGYFNGFAGSLKKPSTLLFTRYNTLAAGAWLRGGNVSALTLAQLQAITGTLSVVVDGKTYSTASVDLSAAASFSAAAATLQTELNASPPQGATFTGAIATTVLTVTVLATGAIIPGQVITGSGVTASTTVVAQLTGAAGGVGTYTVSISQTAASTAMVGTALLGVTYDSVTGGFWVRSGTTGPLSTAAFATGTAAAGLMLTSATGALVSQGAAPATPAGVMNAAVAITQNWASFMTSFDPDGGSGFTNKLAFAAWKNSKNNRYAYVCTDSDVSPTTQVPATGSLGYALKQAGDSGTFPIWTPSFLNQAQLALAYPASLDFSQTDGRTVMAFREQDGLVPGVTDATVAANLGGSPQQAASYGNGYNYYAAFATANDQFIGMQRGTVTGAFQWYDSYVNQVWLNSQFQLALMTLLQNTRSIPYNDQGYALISAALQDPINQALNFGAIRQGVPLSSTEAAEVNQAAGLKIDGVLATRGWYLKIGVASAQTRQGRGTPPMTFYYMDGGSVQSFALASILIQ
jgi:hypothetical protein